MTSISDRLAYVNELIFRSYEMSKIGFTNQSNDLYNKAFIIAENILKNNDHGLFSDEEIMFLKKIVEESNYE